MRILDSKAPAFEVAAHPGNHAGRTTQRRLALLVTCVALIATLRAQASPAPPSFDVASVKRVEGRQGPPLIALQAGGRFYAPATTLKELVRVAYKVEPPPPPAAQAPMTVLNFPRGTPCGAMFLSGWVSARRVSISWFAWQLARQVHRNVLDHTGLAGNFDIDLAYTPDTGPVMLNGQSISGDAPALSTAIREQLGLKLVSTKAAVPVIVIDGAEPPTEN